YRLRKIARRNWRALATAGVSAAVLVAATAVSTWQAVKARDAERRAADEAASATAVKNFLQDDLLRLVDPQKQVSEGIKVNRNFTVREALDRAAAIIDERFRDQPLVEAEIRLTIGNAYLSVWEPRTALAHFEKAVALRKSYLGPGHRETLLGV